MLKNTYIQSWLLFIFPCESWSSNGDHLHKPCLEERMSYTKDVWEQQYTNPNQLKLSS
jgi:hypothetical protein